MLRQLFQETYAQPTPFAPWSPWHGASDASANEQKNFYVGGWLSQGPTPSKRSVYCLMRPTTLGSSNQTDPLTSWLTFSFISKMGGRSQLAVKIPVIADNQGNVFVQHAQKQDQANAHSYAASPRAAPRGGNWPPASGLITLLTWSVWGSARSITWMRRPSTSPSWTGSSRRPTTTEGVGRTIDRGMDFYYGNCILLRSSIHLSLLRSFRMITSDTVSACFTGSPCGFPNATQYNSRQCPGTGLIRAQTCKGRHCRLSDKRGGRSCFACWLAEFYFFLILDWCLETLKRPFPILSIASARSAATFAASVEIREKAFAEQALVAGGAHGSLNNLKYLLISCSILQHLADIFLFVLPDSWHETLLDPTYIWGVWAYMVQLSFPKVTS